MKPSFRNVWLALGIALPLWVMAQTGSVGAVIKGFTLPQRNPAGDLEAQISGEEAVVVSPNRTEIKKLKVELFENGEPSTVITSDRCNLWHLENRLSTTDAVTVSHKSVEITAMTMEWEFKEKRGILRKNVRVVLKDVNLASSGPQIETK